MMLKSEIIDQTVSVEEVPVANATHFAILNGKKIRYLVDLCIGRKYLSQNFIAYSNKLQILMSLLPILPLSLLCKLKLGVYVKAELNPVVRTYCSGQNWNMLVGTYDAKQKVIVQDILQESGCVRYVKVGNQNTKAELAVESSVLASSNRFAAITIPTLLKTDLVEGAHTYVIQVTEAFSGKKVEAALTPEIVSAYEEIRNSMPKSDDGMVFSHGDFAPWNMRKTDDGLLIFDWEHAGFRMDGFDLLHYCVSIGLKLDGLDFDLAYEKGVADIKRYLPNFAMNKQVFQEEYRRIRLE